MRTRTIRGGLPWYKRKVFRETVKIISIYALLIGGAFLVMIPFFWVVSTAFKRPGQVLKFPPVWIPSPIMWSNFPKALTILPFGLYFKNTCIITFSTIIGQLLSASLVAYGFARLRFPGRDIIFLVALSTMMVPPQVTMIPQFILFRIIGWLDTFKPLIVPAFFGGSPFFIFLLRQFFMTIHPELDDAAKIDGCGFFGIYWRIMLPLAKPVLATVGIFSFLWTWNDFLGPLIYLNSMNKRTLSLGLNVFAGYYSTYWNLLMAASLVVLSPCLIIFFFAQKYFVQGVVITGVKG